MPIFYPPPKELLSAMLIDGDMTIESETVRFFPDIELSVDATLEIPVDAEAEII
jgi:hypothetical protein